MTAQIALLTPSCAILAADSAVTIVGGSESRVYTGAEKITPLSNKAPVAALVYGSASVCGVPWNTLLHACCAECDLSTMSIPEATGRLIDFVRDRIAQHLAERGDALREERLQGIMSALVAEVSEQAPTNEINAVTTLATERFAYERDQWAAQERIDGVDEEHELNLHEEHREWALANAQSVYEDAPGDLAAHEALADLILLMFTRRLPPSATTRWAGGVAVLGFGSGELWPSFSIVEFDGVGLDGVRLWPGDDGRSPGPGGAFVRAFAQDAGVKTIMNGLHPDMVSRLGTAMVDNGMADDDVDTLLNDVVNRWHEERTTGILRTLEMMPQPALCEIAESLVAITALEHRLTGSLETVGGTISVAVLAPGEPLRWAKRPSLMTS